MRLFHNEKRISTAVKLKSGAILQVYPKKMQFPTGVQWQAYWDVQLKPKIILRLGEPEAQKVVTPAPLAPLTKVVAKKASLSDWTVMLKKNFTTALPAGTYYIGDLCYVLGRDIYDGIFGGTGYESGIYLEKDTGRVFATSRTAFGDGEFEGSDGKKFAVDAAGLGICSTSLMAKNDGGGHVYTFETPVTCRFVCGRFEFEWKSGRVSKFLSIDTEGDEEYE
jgi:hypothetical protein